MRRIREIENGHAALIPSLRHDVAPRDRNQRAIVRHAILLIGLRDWKLVIPSWLQLPSGNREDRVGAPAHRVRGPAARRHSAAPLVRKNHLVTRIAERGGMPI